MKQVLFITNSSDHAVNSVTAWLEKMGNPFIRINFDTAFSKKQKLTFATKETRHSHIFSVNGISIEQHSVSSICYRRPLALGISQSEIDEFVQAQWTHALWSFSSSLDGYWVNHPLWGKHLLEHNKLYQLKCAALIGLNVPETLISNDISEIISFSSSHNGKVACKPLRHTNLTNEAEQPVGIYTQLVETNAFIGRQKSLEVAPLIIQEYIPKQIELRVTVIGFHVFTCEIHSQNSDRTIHDWRRYDFDKVEHGVHDLPDKIKKQILELMCLLQLNYGALDLILTPAGKYYFLEVNPAGQYGWIEGLTNLPISETFALALLNPTEHGIKKYPMLADRYIP